MKASKRKKLEADGWRIGSASDFLELTKAMVARVVKRETARSAKRPRGSGRA